MATVQYSTTTTTIDRDAELIALRDAIYADCAGPQFTLRDAAECALGQLTGLLEYAEQWDQAADEMLLACYWPAVDSVEELTTEPEPEPPTTPAGQRARAKAEWHLAQGACLVHTHADAWLVPSGTRNAVIHRVADGVCSCEAGANAKPCWHVEAVRIVAHQEQRHAA